jgi:transcriptional antiterminator RfaH
MNDGKPAKIPESLVASLKVQENNEGFLSNLGFSTFTKGDKVRILDGAFKDHEGSFLGLDTKQRIQLLLSFLGREMTLSLPGYSVEGA